MDTLPLPPHPDLEQYRKRAKALVTAANSGDPDAVKQWADDWLRTLTKLLGLEITPFVQHSFDRAVEGIENEVAARVMRAKNEGATFALADVVVDAIVATSDVDDFRQKTPPNAIEIAQRLIGAGALVDALADA